MNKVITALILTAALSGCATRGSNYVPLVDMKDKSTSSFSSDVADCQQYSKQRIDAGEGAVIGAIVGGLFMAAMMPRGYRNFAAGRGAIVGGLAGAGGANETQEGITKTCLSGRGYNVLN